MKKILFLLAAAALFFAWQMKPSNRVITGTISDSIGRIPGVNILIKGTSTGTGSDDNGNYSLPIPDNAKILVFSATGYLTQEVTIGSSDTIDVILKEDLIPLDEVVVTGYGVERQSRREKKADRAMASEMYRSPGIMPQSYNAKPQTENQEQFNTDDYDAIAENRFYETTQNPLSTFSIDVDAASYSNMRRYIKNGQKPPKDAVRIEELVNYFDYEYPQPKGEHPFEVITEVSECPWQSKHRLLHVGMQGKTFQVKICRRVIWCF